MQERWQAKGDEGRPEAVPSDWGGIEIGINFIALRAVPQSDEHWLILEAQNIVKVLRANDPDAAIEAAHDLGMLHEQAHLHNLHGATVSVRAKQLKPFKAGAAQGNRRARVLADAWVLHARQLARGVWSRRPDLSAQAVPEAIRGQVVDKGCKTKTGEPPSVSTIRKRIGPEKPRSSQK
ncbi:MAG: hypothetical protein VYD87_19710 [Pseudomonadota bacterium]|nr:hypothetical protein [Pseudomonadota bacterium]